MEFNHIIGHEDIKEQLEKALQRGNVSHAHLFVGEDGIGKSLIAKEFAIRILCKMEHRQYVDIMEWKVGKNRKSIGVDEVRLIIEEIHKKPYEGDKKVIVVYEMDKMTIQAQNAFLKTIEEPPKGVFLLLLCENLEVILETIKSRCQIHKLKRVTNKEMDIFLKRKYPKLALEDIKTAVAFSEGIPGRAERFIEDSDYKTIRDTVLEILVNNDNKNVNRILKYENFFVQYKLQWKDVLSCFLSYIRDTIIYKETGTEELMMNVDKIDKMKELASIFSFNQLSDMIDIINHTKEGLESNVNLGLAFDVMLLKIQEV